MQQRKAAGMKLNADMRVLLTEDPRRIKARILKNIPIAKAIVKQLRSMKPVPASQKTANGDWTKFSRDSEAALDSLRDALKKDDHEKVGVARENLNSAGR
jgi:hypothetical protein